MEAHRPVVLEIGVLREVSGCDWMKQKEAASWFIILGTC
jgi:hypothetical protein